MKLTSMVTMVTIVLFSLFLNGCSAEKGALAGSIDLANTVNNVTSTADKQRGYVLNIKKSYAKCLRQKLGGCLTDAKTQIYIGRKLGYTLGNIADILHTQSKKEHRIIVGPKGPASPF